MNTLKKRSRESWSCSTSVLYEGSIYGACPGGLDSNNGHNNGVPRATTPSTNGRETFRRSSALSVEAPPGKIEKALGAVVRRRRRSTMSATTFASSGESFRDKTEEVAIHTHNGIEFLERYANFVKDRAVVELDYAKQLNGLVKKYQPKKKDDDPPFTYFKAFNNVLIELQAVANQHELVSENLRQTVLNEIGQICRDLKDHRKMHLSEITRLQQNYDIMVEQMNKLKKEYAKAYKESEAAQLKYDKAEADMNLSRAEVEKAKTQSMQKNQYAEDAKTGYALQLRKTNDMKAQHYNLLLPSVLEKLREVDEARIKHVKQIIVRCVQIEQNVLPIIERCLQCMSQHANDIKAEVDSREVVNRYRSGYGLPADFQFVDLSVEGSSEINGTSNFSSPQAGSRTGGRKGSATISRVQSIGLKKTASVMPRIFNKKNEETFKEDLSELQPAQRCNRLQQKLKEIEKRIETKVSQRDGCYKMETVYKENPKLGDLGQVEVEIDKCNNELNDLNVELQKFQAYYQDALNQMNVPINLPVQQPTVTPSTSRLAPRPQTHSSGSDASSLCHSNSDVSEGVPDKSSSGGTSTSHGSSASPEHRRQYNGNGNGDTELYEPEPYGMEQDTILGTCKALYDFSGGGDGMVPMKEGEELLLMERDAGDGWTKVRKMLAHQEEGFVPTSYLDCHFYPSN